MHCKILDEYKNHLFIQLNRVKGLSKKESEKNRNSKRKQRFVPYILSKGILPRFVVKLLQTAKKHHRNPWAGSILEENRGRRLPKEMMHTN